MKDTSPESLNPHSDEFYVAMRQDPAYRRALEQFEEQLERLHAKAPRSVGKEYDDYVAAVFAAEERFLREQERNFLRRWRAEHGRQAQGMWRFAEILNSVGHLTGWNVSLDGRRAGILVIRGDDLAVLAAGGMDDPGPHEIMAAFLKLYPGGAAEARALPRGRAALPEGESPFGPSRDWSLEGYEADGYRRRR